MQKLPAPRTWTARKPFLGSVSLFLLLPMDHLDVCRTYFFFEMVGVPWPLHHAHSLFLLIIQ